MALVEPLSVLLQGAEHFGSLSLSLSRLASKASELLQVSTEEGLSERVAAVAIVAVLDCAAET